MDEYIIRCTSEQTKKALELGAPIEILPNYTEYRVFPLVKCKDGNDRPCIIPTAEQMLGWLEEQGVSVEITMASQNIGYYSLNRIDRKGAFDFTGRCEKTYSSRKGATLAAIDAALEYLAKEG